MQGDIELTRISDSELLRADLPNHLVTVPGTERVVRSVHDVDTAPPLDRDERVVDRFRRPVALNQVAVDTLQNVDDSL